MLRGLTYGFIRLQKNVPTSSTQRRYWFSALPFFYFFLKTLFFLKTRNSPRSFVSLLSNSELRVDRQLSSARSKKRSFAVWWRLAGDASKNMTPMPPCAKGAVAVLGARWGVLGFGGIWLFVYVCFGVLGYLVDGFCVGFQWVCWKGVWWCWRRFGGCATVQSFFGWASHGNLVISDVWLMIL